MTNCEKKLKQIVQTHKTQMIKRIIEQEYNTNRSDHSTNQCTNITRIANPKPRLLCTGISNCPVYLFTILHCFYKFVLAKDKTGHRRRDDPSDLMIVTTSIEINVNAHYNGHKNGEVKFCCCYCCSIRAFFITGVLLSHCTTPLSK